MTRIVAGAAGGRRLAVPPKGTRPTTDRVREAVFNMLAARLDFDGISVVDLYAGSGALGLEALSRGAAPVLFVEHDRRAAEVITANIAAVGLPGAHLRRGSVATVLAAGAARELGAGPGARELGAGPGAAADLVFADPPYDMPAAEVDSMLALLDSDWVSAGSIVIVERSVGSPPLAWPSGWEPWPQRRYGDTRIDTASC